MSTDKVQGALRVMEALSAVDDELLERSKRATVRRKPDWAKSGDLRRFVQRYGGLCAACLCLLVLGAAYYGLTQIRMGSASERKDSNSIGNMSGGAAAQEAAEPEPAFDVGENIADEFQMVENEGAGDGAQAAMFDEVPQWLDIDALAAQQEKSGQEADRLMEEDRLDNLVVGELQSPAETEQEMKKMFESFWLPDGYRQAEDSGNGSPETETSRLFHWMDGTYALWLRLTETDLSADLRYESEPPVYTVQEEWIDLIPEAGADGYVQFALLYEDGLLAEYRGALTREEIQALLRSVAE